VARGDSVAPAAQRSKIVHVRICGDRRSAVWLCLGLFLATCGGGGEFTVRDGATPGDLQPLVVRNPDTGPGGIGLTCDVLTDAGGSQGVYNSEALECPSRICLKPALQPGVATTSTAAFCSASCTQDSDCAGESGDSANPLDTRCRTGFVCAIPFVKGKLCCMRLCLCKDFLSSTAPSTPIACQGDAGLTCDE